VTVVLPLSIGADAPPLIADLDAVGLRLLESTNCDNLVRDALRLGPDAIVGWVARPDDSCWRALDLLQATAPRPVVMFTQDPSVESMECALQRGVHAWVVNGYARERLRNLVQLAAGRFQHQRSLHERLDELERRFEERKLVDRAKGLLMRASQISEDQAFALLRGASMRGKERVGMVSRRVIDAAREAESINRAGQLRMLAQRAVKLAALQLLEVEPARTRAQLDATLERGDDNLGQLARALSRPTWGDLLDALADGWAALRAVRLASSSAEDLSALDAAAEECVARADRLVDGLQSAGVAPTLHVVNLSGRQRMLSQRVAKQALLSVALQRGERIDAPAVAEFERALASLQGLPLSTREIRETLGTARSTWSAMLASARQVGSADGRRVLASSSEALLELLERLTERYERTMQLLVG
jgi:AmiR/NasT family two-component response regulator